ncbi:Rv3235 family protein [Streptomyces halobius]|uniref:Rv3235 family protein n=1 Tax=Streptomyces halobius TaxID=2879846 RepID=A0ABY4MBQ6_9ACTN|nr:Rv3235 family protein [Streptomyces halobius]UQA95130.1 Rv3235 family protein [Streptomyces halobius]
MTGTTTSLSTPDPGDGSRATAGPRGQEETTLEPTPTVPRPRRAPGARRTDTPAASDTSRRPGRGTGPGRGPGLGPGRTRPATPSITARTTPGRPLPSSPPPGRQTPARPAPRTPVNAAGAPLPTVGARRRAHEQRPHHWFAHQLLLTLSGQRPVHALLGHALGPAYDRLVELAPQAPLRPVLGPDRRQAVPTVRDCGLCRPRSGVIEAFARIAAGERLRALAFRLELGADSRWRCTALDIGPTRTVWGPTP